MLNKIKIFFVIICSFFLINFSFLDFSFASLEFDVNVSTSWNNSNDWKIKNWIVNSINDTTVISSSNTTVPWFFKYVKDQIYLLVWIIAISMIVWIWVRISTARWNPEEFKKAWLHLVYLILWLFFVFAAWWIVNIVANLNIF